MIHKSLPPPHSPPVPPSPGSIERTWSDITTVASGFSLPLWKYVTSISAMLNKMTPALGLLPNLAVWVLMTGPIVFLFKAIQLGVISPLSDYQWPIDSRKDTLIKGHLNVSRCRVMGRNIAFKMQFVGKYPCTANDRHNMFTLLSANSLYRHIYGNGSRGNTKMW